MATATQRIQDVTQAPATAKPRVALDTCCVQYYISNPPVQPWADCLDPVFRAGVEGKIELYVSTIVVSELLAHVHFAHRNTGYDPELDLLAILNRHFQVLEVSGDVASAAGRLRGNYVPGGKMTLKTPDALIGATSLLNGHTLFITNDAQLADALPDSNCIYLKDVALDWLSKRFSGECFSSHSPVNPLRRGPGLPNGTSLASVELGSIKPDPAAKWKRILSDAFTVAAAISEPCIFFVLTTRVGRKTECTEVLFWHEGLNAARPPKRLIKRLYEHLGYSQRTGIANNPKNHVVSFCFTSLEREKARQLQPCFASKSDHQREADSWNGYLSLFRVFSKALSLPQTSWLLCEDGVARTLDTDATIEFLDQAKNVLGWKDER